MRENRGNNSSRGGLLIVIGICLFLLLVSSLSSSFNNALRSGINAVLLPMQQGMNKVGRYLFGEIEDLRELKKVQEENELLKEELAKLQEEMARLKLKENELAELRQLLRLGEQYPEYETVGAHVIGKNAGNWYQSFMIDKGEADGLSVGMNVLAGGGLVGIITSLGVNNATVSAIINDGQYVSAMSARGGANFILAGDLSLYSDKLLKLENIGLSADVAVGDTVVTSNISDIYLPGLLIGYVESIETQPNQLLRSGTLRPVADFDKLDTVLVITTLKDSGE